MSKRVSNEQLMTALTDLPSAIAAAIQGTPDPVLPKATPEADESAGNDQTVNVDGAYLAHVSGKLQGRSNDDGKTYVLYARLNKANETKLAYCEASKWSALTDKRIIGAVKTVSPE